MEDDEVILCDYCDEAPVKLVCQECFQGMWCSEKCSLADADDHEEHFCYHPDDLSDECVLEEVEYEVNDPHEARALMKEMIGDDLVAASSVTRRRRRRLRRQRRKARRRRRKMRRKRLKQRRERRALRREQKRYDRALRAEEKEARRFEREQARGAGESTETLDPIVPEVDVEPVVSHIAYFIL